MLETVLIIIFSAVGKIPDTSECNHQRLDSLIEQVSKNPTMENIKKAVRFEAIQEACDSAGTYKIVDEKYFEKIYEKSIIIRVCRTAFILNDSTVADSFARYFKIEKLQEYKNQRIRLIRDLKY